MKNLFDTADTAEILNRLDQLNSACERQWGTMSPDQMLAHCSEAMEVATGKKSPSRLFIGRILGPILKNGYVGEKPFAKNLPTDKSFVASEKKDFNKEKERLRKLICEFSERGAVKCSANPHPFFGKLSPMEWSIAMQKHLDHHFRQFGV